MRITRCLQFVNEMQPAAGMPRIEEDRGLGRQARSERFSVIAMRDRRHRQHDQIDVRDRVRDIRRHPRQRDCAVMDAADLDGACGAQVVEPLLAPRVQSDVKPAKRKVGRCGTAAMTCAQDCNGLDRLRHARLSLLRKTISRPVDCDHTTSSQINWTRKTAVSAASRCTRQGGFIPEFAIRRPMSKFVDRTRLVDPARSNPR